MDKMSLNIGWLLGLVTVFSLVAPLKLDASENLVRLATLGPEVGNFAPVLYFEDNEIKGSMPAQISCAFTALGYHIKYIPVPIGRHVWATEKHQADGYFPATSFEVNTSPEQTSITLLESEIAVYSLEPVNIYSQPAPVVGIVRLAMAPENVVSRHQLPAIRTSSFTQAIDLLLKKRVDAVIANNKGFELAAKNGNYQFSWHKQPLESVKMRLYLSPNYTVNHPDILTRLNPELIACKDKAQHLSH